MCTVHELSHVNCFSKRFHFSAKTFHTRFTNGSTSTYDTYIYSMANAFCSCISFMFVYIMDGFVYILQQLLYELELNISGISSYAHTHFIITPSSEETIEFKYTEREKHALSPSALVCIGFSIFVHCDCFRFALFRTDFYGHKHKLENSHSHHKIRTPFLFQSQPIAHTHARTIGINIGFFEISNGTSNVNMYALIFDRFSWDFEPVSQCFRSSSSDFRNLCKLCSAV